MRRSLYAILVILAAVILTGASIYKGNRFADAAVPIVVAGTVVVAISLVAKEFSGAGLRVRYRDDEDEEREQGAE